MDLTEILSKPVGAAAAAFFLLYGISLLLPRCELQVAVRVCAYLAVLVAISWAFASLR